MVNPNRIRALLACAVITLAVVTTASAERARVYRVTITNLTKSQVFSPPVLATHDSVTRVFALGEAASDELAKVAEDGDGTDLVTLLESMPEVFDVVQTPVGAPVGPIAPGDTLRYDIEATKTFNRLSIVGMLVNTNDAFFGVNTVEVLAGRRIQVMRAQAYDAGSEDNNEDCGFIPGPACPMMSGNARDLDGAEGFVYVHNGIHGIADLETSAYDWRNPVARVTVQRIRRTRAGAGLP